MIIAWIDELALKAKERYEGSNDILDGAWSVAINTNEPYNIVRRKLEDSTEADLIQYMTLEEYHVKGATQKIAMQAVRDALRDVGMSIDSPAIPESVGELLSATESYLLGELHAQTTRDRVLVIKNLRKWVISAMLIAADRGISQESAKIELRLTKAPNQRFSFTDKIGRKSVSSQHVHSVWRQHLLWTYNEVYMLTVLNMLDVVTAGGVTKTKITVKHEDETHKDHGVEVFISPTMTPSYANIRDEVFHPNARAVVALK